MFLSVTAENCITVSERTDGLAKLQCPKAGAVSVSKLMGRRHEQVDFYPPPGQEIDN